MLQIDFLGHASFRFSHTKTGVTYLDPWLSGNPEATERLENIRTARQVLVTHGHAEHLADAIPICLRTGATLVATPEICAFAARQGLSYGRQARPLNLGGRLRDEDLEVIMVQAFHASGIQGRAYAVDRHSEPDGGAVGYVLNFAQDATVYVSGDTNVFGDMRLIGELYAPEIAILPIGGKVTMGPLEAAKALEMLRPAIAIPCHFDGTAGLLDEFRRRVAVASPRTRVVALTPGEGHVHANPAREQEAAS